MINHRRSAIAPNSVHPDRHAINLDAAVWEEFASLHSRQSSGIKTADLKHDRPPVAEALARMERELRLARQQGYAAVKFIHGYGSSGAGGDIRIAVQKSLVDQLSEGQIRAVIFGEDWRISNEHTWKLLREFPEFKRDRDLGHANKGITIVVL